MKENIPVLLLKKLTLLPTSEVRIELNNDLSKRIIDSSIKEFHNKVLVILPTNPMEESPTVTDLPKVGVLALINSKLVLPNKNYRVVLKGLNRVQINDYSNNKDKSILIANVKRLYIDNGESLEEVALKKKLYSLLNLYISSSSEASNSILAKVSLNNSLDEMTDIIVNFMHFNKDKKIFYMNEFSEVNRAKELIKDLNVELEMIKLNNKIEDEIKSSFAKEQKEYLLKQKIDKLNEELGIDNSKDSEVALFRNKLSTLDISDSIRKRLDSEIKKYEYTPTNNPEVSLIRSYIETMLSLPYNISSKEEVNADKIRKSLDKTHYGLEEIKERICEYILMKKYNPNLANPIICLVGLPGVGKSTIAESISASLKRNFYKINVGGLNDGSELIGYRRTYLGSAPGKIMNAIMKCETNNPVILIDEVDKMVKDYKGDPASILLDILDAKQNINFRDNYLDEPFDLSKVLFILTANDVTSIPAALKDRLEIINVPSYTVYDKLKIASDYLLPLIIKNYAAKKVKISDEVILKVINDYTLESGVRELNRLLDKIVRYYLIHELKEVTISDLKDILGNPINDHLIKPLEIGECNIIGVSPLGGILVKIESAYITSGINITGNIGESLKDSAMLVIDYLDASGYLNKKKDFHLHFTNANYLKDGYSGSLGIAVSLMSLIKKVKIKEDTAFIGSMDLFGNILKVSSLKEKIITAYNNHLKTIYLSKENKEDDNLIPEFILKDLNIIYVSNFNEIESLLFKKK